MITMSHALTYDFVQTVRDIVVPSVRRTPMLRSEWLSGLSGGDVYLKCENLQRTGSFKLRGAVAAVALLPSAKRDAGVVACSAGNHGLGLAYAAAMHGIACTIVVPNSVPAVKEQGIRALGARVVKSPFSGYDLTHTWTLEHLEELGGTFVSPFEHAAVMAGNGGTTMLEILEDVAPLDAVIMPCGGGGCAIGAGIVAKTRSPQTRIIGVNTDASPGMWLSRRDGRAHVAVESRPTIAEGIEGGVTELSFRLGQKYIDDVVVVRESTIRHAVAELARREHLVVEGSGASAVAAVLDRRIEARRMCIVLTGGNIDSELLSSLLLESDTAAAGKLTDSPGTQPPGRA